MNFQETDWGHSVDQSV